MTVHHTVYICATIDLDKRSYHRQLEVFNTAVHNWN